MSAVEEAAYPQLHDEVPNKTFANAIYRRSLSRTCLLIQTKLVQRLDFGLLRNFGTPQNQPSDQGWSVLAQICFIY